MLNAVVAPKRKKEPPFDAYMRLATQELSFFGHRDANGNVTAITADSRVPSREELIEGYMSVAIIVTQEVDGVRVTSEPHYPTRAEAERAFPEIAHV